LCSTSVTEKNLRPIPHCVALTDGLQSHLGQGIVELDGTKTNLNEQSNRMTEIIFEVERDAENGWLTASWDAPRGQGGISTQGKDLSELEHNVREAVRCHFENGN